MTSTPPPARKRNVTPQQTAPDVALPNLTGAIINLAGFRNNKHFAFYFYPKDDTPSCTFEANQFTALADEFAKHDTMIFSVCKDSCENHQQFISKYNLKDGQLCERDGI